jgi:hypothetical protein
MSQTLIVAAIFVPAVLLAVTLYWLDRVRRREALFHWASTNGYRLLGFRQPVLTEASPFPWALSKAQHVFHVDVEHPGGQRQSGWVRLGSAWRGLKSKNAENAVKVHWEQASG